MSNRLHRLICRLLGHRPAFHVYAFDTHIGEICGLCYHWWFFEPN